MAQPINETSAPAQSRISFHEEPVATVRPRTINPVRAFFESESMQRCCAVTGRTLLALIFLLSGAMKLMDWAGNEQMMAQKGMVAIPFFLAAAAIVEIVGGLSIFLGFQARLGALLLFLYLIPVTVMMHDFWNESGMMRQMQMFNFLKNLAIMGGLCMIITFGAGLCSLDAWQRRRGADTVA